MCAREERELCAGRSQLFVNVEDVSCEHNMGVKEGERGAKEVHMCLHAPPHPSICYTDDGLKAETRL